MSDDFVLARCPSCAKEYRIAAERAGKIAKCGCGERFRVPESVDWGEAMSLPSSEWYFLQDDRVGLAPHAIAELRLDHAEGAFDVAPLMIVLENIFPMKAVE